MRTILKRFFITIILVAIIYTSTFTGFNINSSMAVNKTGGTATITLANENYKIGSFWTYIKNGVRSLDLYCSQHGAHLDSYNNYTYEEVNWDNEAGIFKDEYSFKRLTWIKNNFWESTYAGEDDKYTTEQKLQILKLADDSITLGDVEAVFNNVNEKFKLYQTITWNYVNNVSNSQYALAGSTSKIFNAITVLANRYANYIEDKLELKETSEVVQNSNGTYTWGMQTTNTFLLPYTHKLLIDGNEWTNYSYDGNVITISGVEAGIHSFEFLVSTYQVSSTASIWINNVKQNMIEITNTKKQYKEVSKTTEGGQEGYYALKVKKVDENNKPLKGIGFKVGNTTYTTNDNGEAIVIDNAHKVEIQKPDEVYEYTIEELDTGLKGYSKLKNAVTIQLKSGVRSSNGNLIYCIRSANFKDNGMNTINAQLENGKSVKLQLNTSNNNDTTIVTLTVPNAEKIFDLALTKTMIISDDEALAKYDFNFDGVVNALDSSIVIGALEGVTDFNPNRYKQLIRENIQTKYAELYNKHYKDMDDDEILSKFDLNNDGGVNLIDTGCANTILDVYAAYATGKDIDRIKGISAQNLNKNNITTATYNMDKSLRKVKRSDIITYKINVYNEGDYAAKEVEVTDYLPEGLVVCDKNGNTNLNSNKEIVCTYGEKDYTWRIDGKTAKITINDEIGAFDGRTLKDRKVYITCKIEESVNTGEVLYNVAEITKAKAIDTDGKVVGVQGETIEDRDSKNNSVKGSNTVQQLIDKYEERFLNSLNGHNDQYIEKSVYNYQDDDDFERIVIGDTKELDLALRKSISKIGNSFENMKDTQNRLPEINESTVDYCKRTGTGTYYHGKQALNVNINDYIEYTIRVYNEGSSRDYNGYAKQITDYLPSGVEFYAIVNKDGSWINEKNTNGKYVTETNGYGGYEVTYDKGKQEVVINGVKTPELSTKNNLNDIYNLYKSDKEIRGYYTSDEFKKSAYAYQEVKIICKVTDEVESTYLTNIAEITNSVAVVDGKEDLNIEDRDSIYGNIQITEEKSDLKNKKINLNTYYEENKVNDIYVSYYPGLEDDDDFECIKVPVTTQIHKGVKDILNQDSGYNGDEEHDWVIQTNVPTGISKFNKYIVTDTIDERLVFDKETGIQKVIVKIGDRQLVKDTDYKITYDEGERQLKLYFIAPEEVLKEAFGEDYVGSFTAGKSFEEDSIIEIRFKTTFAKDEQGNIIALNQEIPNQATLIYDNGNGKDQEKKSEIPEVHTGAVAVYKYNEETKVALEGAKFKIATSKENAEKGTFVKDVNGKDIEAISNNKGIATFTGLEFGGDANASEANKKEDGTYSYNFDNAKKTYYIVETEAPEGFNKLEGVIEVEVSKNATLTEIENMESVANTPITPPGTPEIHKGVKDVLNQDSGYNGDGEHDWVINASVPTKISQFNKYIVTDILDERLVFAGLEKVTVKIGNRQLVKDTDYKIKYNESTRQLKLYFIAPEKVLKEEFGEDYVGEFIAGRSFEENSIIEIRFKTTFAKDAQGNIIALNQEIPNQATLIYDNGNGQDEEKKSEIPEVHTGAVAVYKYNEKTKVALQGAKFKIATSKENAERGTFVKDVNGKDIEEISNNKGIATFTGLEFGGDANASEANKKEDGTYSYNFDNAKKTYYIVETEAPEGFNKHEGAIEVEVSKHTTLTEIKDMKSIANSPEEKDFDLALRKFITGVNNKEVTNRIPVFKIDKDGKYVYNHDKEPVLVANGNIVTYTLRVYNEGEVAGYAKEIKDDIPEGLEFLPDDELNKEYRWIMLDEEGNETDEVNKAKYIASDYLSKENEKTDGENLIKAFDKSSYDAGSIKEPDYKEVKVAFKVTMPNTSDEIIINKAQISDDSDEDGNEVTDKDSTPNEWIDGDDDQDIEKIKVQYFDLALRKWITKAIVIEDGKERVYETGHTAEDNPEEVVKVDLKKSKLNKVVVKFEYQIRVTNEGNEGQIAGSVEEISDYIPEGLKFVAADNEKWEEVDGKVVTDQLAGQIIQPGESKEVTILLTWINSENNMGLKVNIAEISKDYNEYGSPDIDSTPNNKVPGEDDIDDAPVMLTVTTGETAIYVGLGITILAILAGGVIGIKKFVIK